MYLCFVNKTAAKQVRIRGQTRPGLKRKIID
jgi:hypothetical protein